MPFFWISSLEVSRHMPPPICVHKHKLQARSWVRNKHSTTYSPEAISPSFTMIIMILIRWCFTRWHFVTQFTRIYLMVILIILSLIVYKAKALRNQPLGVQSPQRRPHDTCVPKYEFSCTGLWTKFQDSVPYSGTEKTFHPNVFRLLQTI